MTIRNLCHLLLINGWFTWSEGCYCLRWSYWWNLFLSSNSITLRRSTIINMGLVTSITQIISSIICFYVVSLISIFSSSLLSSIQLYLLVLEIKMHSFTPVSSICFIKSHNFCIFICPLLLPSLSLLLHILSWSTTPKK